MTIVLTPYVDSNGTQKLKVLSQGTFGLFATSMPITDTFAARPKPARGLTPPTLDENVHFVRCLAQLRSKDKAIEKNIYLGQLKDANPSMFYKMCLAHMSEITPLIYTPTVGDACLQYSQNYRRPEGLVSHVSSCALTAHLN